MNQTNGLDAATEDEETSVAAGSERDWLRVMQ